jgi:two-component system, OmpR family, sensor kinase
MPIRWRLTLFGAGVITAAVTVLTLLIYALAVTSITRDQDRALRTRAGEALSSLQQASADALEPGPWPAAVNLATSLEVFVLVLGADGAPVTGTVHLDGAAPPIPTELLTRASESGGVTDTFAPRDGLPVRVHIRPWDHPDLGLSGFVVAGQAERAARQEIRGLRVFLVVSAVITLIGAMAASWLAAGRALRPLKSVAAATERIGRTGDLSSRLPAVRTKDEVGQLTESFNSMLERVQDAYGKLADTLEVQKRFVADASHELRTPLTPPSAATRASCWAAPM